MSEFTFLHRSAIHVSAVGARQVPDGEVEYIRQISIGFHLYHGMPAADDTIVKLQAVAMVTTDKKITLAQIDFRNDSAINDMFQFYQDLPPKIISG
jgi:hypothetical protein